MNIIFDNIINARDLGGMKAHNGQTVRPHLLLRTAHLHDATDNDADRLKQQYHLQKVFDFRSMQEMQFLPDRQIEGVQYHLLPTIDMRKEQQTGQAIPEEAFQNLEAHIVNYSFYPQVQQMAANMYPSLIRSEYSQLQYAAFLRLIIEAQPPCGAMLWHCSQGKDRTGWGAAFLLFALGVSKEDIIHDFNLSNLAYQDIVSRLDKEVVSRGGGENEMNVIHAFMGVSTNNFIRTLGIIDDEYNGIGEYLKNQLFLTKSDLQILRNRYLV